MNDTKIQMTIVTNPGQTNGWVNPSPRTTIDLIEPVGNVPGKQ